ncbi:hypothetical protein DTX79_01580 [Bacilli bacterium]|nr:hypothetical protein DTX79_01580 [Bacilli bacterium]
MLLPAYEMKDAVEKHKDKLLNIDVEKSKEGRMLNHARRRKSPLPTLMPLWHFSLPSWQRLFFRRWEFDLFILPNKK